MSLSSSIRRKRAAFLASKIGGIFARIGRKRALWIQARNRNPVWVPPPEEGS